MDNIKSKLLELEGALLAKEIQKKKAKLKKLKQHIQLQIKTTENGIDVTI